MKRSSGRMRVMMLVCIVVLLFTAGSKVYARDPQEDPNQEESPQKETELLREVGGYELYRHQVSQNGYSLTMNDIVLTEEQMTEVLALDTGEQQKKMIQSTNLLLRREPGNRILSTRNVIVSIGRNERLRSAALPCQVTMEFMNASIALQITSTIYLAPEGMVTPPPVPPPDDGDEQDIRPVRPPFSNPDPEKVYEWVIEETQPDIFIYEIPEVSPGVTQSSLEANVSEAVTAPESNKLAEEVVIDTKTVRPLTAITWSPAIPKSNLLWDKAYIVTIGGSGLLVVIYAILFFGDLRVIYWYTKKRRRIKEAMKCRH